MSKVLIISVSLGYLLLLFVLAYWAERRGRWHQSLVSNPWVYALSLGVYCTAWTFYGSVGQAATGGLRFLPIFLGPSLAAPIWLLVMRKMIIISKHQRITSIADFLSSRYGKSTSMGVLTALVAVIGIVPYISIQLKAISQSYLLLSGQTTGTEWPFYLDPAFYITLLLALFIILFGTRNLDPNERHEGMVAAIAFESLFKLIIFLAVGLFVVFGLFNGFGPLFEQGFRDASIAQTFRLDQAQVTGWEWFWMIALSMGAIFLLPRQFHVAVVENTDPDHLTKSAWLLPLYLLLINVLVIPIAVGGLILFPGSNIDPDTFVLSIPLETGHTQMALLAGLGGFSAASGMVIVSVIALSIMINNQLVLPLIFKPRWPGMDIRGSLKLPLLTIRRIAMLVVMILAYWFFRVVAREYTLVSIGLISFTAIAQFAPALFAGMYWKQANKAGAIAGVSIGFLMWAFLLPASTLIEAGILPGSVFGLQPFWEDWMAYSDNARIAHTAFWSLLFNAGALFLGAMYRKPTPLEITQADLFVDIYKYAEAKGAYQVIRRKARIGDLRRVMVRFLGKPKTKVILEGYHRRSGHPIGDHDTGQSELINLAETHLAGAIGASSAKAVMASIVKDDPMGLEEMFQILEQTQEILQYSQELERKSRELEQTSQQLRQANEKLKELDKLKAEFIATVTHELRTPITSIKAMSKILLDNPEVSGEQRTEFLRILVAESERIARLINQVLDIVQIDNQLDDPPVPVDLVPLVRQSVQGVQAMVEDRRISVDLDLPEGSLRVLGNRDRLTQVVMNLLSNALKFTDPDQGEIRINLREEGHQALISVGDNGKGIAPDKQKLIFEKFTQVSDQQQGKPAGSGLGLFITRKIVEQHRGQIMLTSSPGAGTEFTVALPKFLVPVDAFTWR